MSSSTPKRASTRWVSASCSRHRIRPAGSAREPAMQGEVVERVQLEDETEVLVDEAQPVRHGVPEVEGLALEVGDGARIRVVVARQALDQRRLARSVLTHKGMDLAAPDVQRDVIQGAGPRERLGQTGQAEHRFVHVLCHLSSTRPN